MVMNNPALVSNVPLLRTLSHGYRSYALKAYALARMCLFDELCLMQ